MKWKRTVFATILRIPLALACSFGALDQQPSEWTETARGMSTGAAIVVGAVAGLALGILVSITTDVPLAPEIGVALGALFGWLLRRGGE
jgi:hypothetical protein